MTLLRPRTPHLLLVALLLLGVVLPGTAQVVTTDPVFPTIAEPVTIYFHAAEGSGGLEGYTGRVYAHTGIITTSSSPQSGCTGVGWQNVKTHWGVNSAETELERLGPNEYRLQIDDIRSYYGYDGPDEGLLKLAFVFRSEDSKLEGKDTGNCDIFVDLHAPGLNVTVVSPVVSQLQPFVAERDTTVRVTAIAASSGAPLAGVRLSVDGAEVASTENDTLVYDLVLDEPGRRWEVVVAAEDVNGAADTTGFYAVRNPELVEAPRPAGVVDGINYGADETQVTLSLYAPYKAYVYVLGDFNDWQVDPDYFMKREAPREDSAHFWITLDGFEPGREYAFQYLVDGELRIADPYAEKILFPEDSYISEAAYPGLKGYPTGRTVEAVSVLQTGQEPYAWQVPDFERPEPEELVIYELHIRDFVGSHTFATVADTLDYLQRLGVNAIELMPVNEFEGNESWGYNPSFYFAPDKYYGPAEELKRLVDEAHARGMAVILDIVLNHSYGQSPMVRMYFDGGGPSAENPWYNERHNFANPSAQWGYDFDHESPATQAFVDRVTRFWLEEYNVDGFRFDFTKGFSNTPWPASGANEWGSAYDADRIRLLKRMIDAMWEVEPGSYAIMEHLADNREERELADYGMLLWGNLHWSYKQSVIGYMQDSDFSWGYYENRGWSQPHLVTYMESHDEERLMYEMQQHGIVRDDYDIRSLPVALDRLKMAGAFFFTLPGPKMIWQFGELGYDVPINFGCRVCNKPIRWNYLRDPLRRKLYETWAALLQLRAAEEVFTSEETEVTMAVGSAVKRLQLTHPTMQVTIVGNFGVRAVEGAEPGFQQAGWWYDYFSGDSLFVDDERETVRLEPGEFHLYTSRRLEPPASGLITVDAEPAPQELPEGLVLEQNYPNPFNPVTTIRFALPAAGDVRLEVFDLLGRRVARLVEGPQAAGVHAVTFDARGLPSGAYLYRLEAGGRVETRWMTVLK